MFKQSSGDLLLALCDLMSVSWQIMVDDKVSGQRTLYFVRELAPFPASMCLIFFVFAEFLDICDNWQKETTPLVEMPNLRIAELQSKRIEFTLMKHAKDFFENEKSNSTKSKIDFTDQHVRFPACPLLIRLQIFQSSTWS